MSPLAALLAAALQADGVSYAARVGADNKVWVDIENATRRTVKVTSMTVLFYDKRENVVDRRTLDCERDCTISRASTESFGPIEGPMDWDTVKVSKVLYEDGGQAEARPAPATPASRPDPGTTAAPSPAAPLARPSSAPRQAAAIDWGSPEAVLRAFYVALNRGDVARAREYHTGFGGEDVVAWAKTETKDSTIMDVKLLDKVDEATPQGRAEISFADGAKTRRRVFFKREGAGWKIERLEPSP